MVALPNTFNWDYILKQVRRYNEKPSDDLLYRIGTHVNALTLEDQDLIERHQGCCLNPEQRFRVLNWLVCQDEIEIKGDLALLIFGRNQLLQWQEISRQAYPDFEFYLVFEFHPLHESGWESGINYSVFWHPKPNSPMPSSDCDFPWRLFWDSGEMFWGNFPGNTKNDIEFTLSVYPNQSSFATPGWVCEEGDRYCSFTDEEADLMSVAQVLACPMLNAR